MQCSECGKHLRRTLKRFEADTLYKEYICKNGHTTTYRRYGKTIEINGKQIQVNEWYEPPQITPSP